MQIWLKFPLQIRLTLLIRQMNILVNIALIARFMGPKWGPSGAHRTQVGPMLAPWTLLSGRSILWLLIPWLLGSPGHQQPWYNVGKAGHCLSCGMISPTCTIQMIENALTIPHKYSTCCRWSGTDSLQMIEASLTLKQLGHIFQT